MAKKQAKNQLPLDFTARGDRMVYCFGEKENRVASEKIFEGLLREEWTLEPSGDHRDVSPAEDIIRHIGYRLPYPEVVKIAKLQDTEAGFKGFAAVYRQQGWVVVPDPADGNERNFSIYLLTVILGLSPTYPARESLEGRALAIVSEVLMPSKEVSTFFHSEVSKIGPAMAGDIADYFKVPFPAVLQRALDLRIISPGQYEGFLSVRPGQRTKPGELYVTGEGGMEDLERHLFGEEER